GIKFGLVEVHNLAVIKVKGEDGSVAQLGMERAKELWAGLKAQGYIDSASRVTDELRRTLKAGQIEVPEGFEGNEVAIREVLRKACGRLEVKDADKKMRIPVNRKVLDGPEFRELWDRIKHKT